MPYEILRGEKGQFIKGNQSGHLHLGCILKEETRIKMSEAHKGKTSGTLGKHWKVIDTSKMHKNRGEKHYLWKGGITPLNEAIRLSSYMKNWRMDVFARDSFRCQVCKQVGIDLEAHHIITFSNILQEFKIKSLQEARDCPSLWNINNGITLCIGCHDQIHKRGKRFQNDR
jgi:hypothetical protein